jgi:adsorption protein B
LIPRFAMIQTPVLSLPRRLTELTAGVYIDEFAELHSKDLLVRERLGRNVPSAGVGTAFSREAVERLATANQNQLFRLDSLTEDYDFGFRLGDLGLSQIFVRFPIEREREKRSLLTGRTRRVLQWDYVATREYFPNQFWASVRQKTRWVLGIALQGWRHLGWRGDWRRKYVLFRDRKILFTSQVNMLGYAVVLLVLGFWSYQTLVPGAYVFPPLARLDGWLGALLALNGGFFLLRLTQRCIAVSRLYGIRHGLMSAPRLVWGNVIMFLACWRALAQFARFLRTGETIRWDKTDHAFPSEKQLLRLRRKLGDLLLERRFITVMGLSQALEVQRRTGQPLGTILVEHGLAREEEILEVLGAQLRLAVKDVDPYAVPDALLARLPAETAQRCGVFPIGESDGCLEIATDRLLSREELTEIEEAAGQRVQICLATRAEVAFAIRRRYAQGEGSGAAPSGPRLGDRLVAAGLLTSAQLEETLREQRRRFRRLGDVLVERGWIDRERLEAVAAEARAAGVSLGEVLLREGYLSEAQLAEGLRQQEASDRRLGDLLVEKRLLTQQVLDDALRTSSR